MANYSIIPEDTSENATYGIQQYGSSSAEKAANLTQKKESKLNNFGVKGYDINDTIDNNYSPAELQLLTQYVEDNYRLADNGTSGYGNGELAYDGPTGRFYMVGTNREDQPRDYRLRDLKPGITTLDSVDERYQVFPSGPEGVNVEDTRIDWLIPEQSARALEALYKGNTFSQGQQVAPYNELTKKADYDRFGSGRTEILRTKDDGTGVFDASSIEDIPVERRQELYKRFAEFEESIFRQMRPNYKGPVPTLQKYTEVEKQLQDQSQVSTVSNTHVKGILDVIGSKEAPLGYNQVYGKNKQIPLGNMTLDEVLSWQKQVVRDGSPSSAVGRYQFINKTLSGLKDSTGISGDTLFTPELQDKFAEQLLVGRGYNDFASGKISKEEFANNLAKEWASFPVVSGAGKGRSYYDGDGLNTHLISVEDVLSTLDGRPPESIVTSSVAANSTPSSTSESRAAAYQEEFLRQEAEKMSPVDRGFNALAAMGKTLSKEVLIDSADLVGDALNSATNGFVGWDIGNEEEKTKMADEFFGFNKYAAEEEYAKARVYADRLVEAAIDENKDMDYSDAFELVKIGITTPEMLGDSLGFLGSFFVPFLGWGGKASKAKKVSDIHKALQAGKITTQQAKSQVSMANKLGTVRELAQNHAGLMQVSANNVNDQIEDYTKEHGEAPSVLKVASMFATETLLLGLDRMADLSILKSPAALKGFREAFIGLAKVDKVKVVTKALGVAAGLVANMGKEAGQEYLQEIGQQFNVAFNFDDNGDFLSAVNEAGEVFLSKEMQVSGVIGAGLGAGGSVQFAGMGALGNGVKSIGAKLPKPKDKVVDTVTPETTVEPTEEETSKTADVVKVNSTTLGKAGNVTNKFVNNLLDQAEDIVPYILGEGSEPKIKGKVFTKTSYKKDIADIDEALAVLDKFKPSSEKGIKDRDNSIKVLKYSKDRIINEALETEDLILGSKLEVETFASKYIDDSLEGEDLSLPEAKGKKAKDFLINNGLTEKDYEAIKKEVIAIRKDPKVIREEATIGPKGYLSYAKRIQSLVDTGNPSRKALEKEFKGLRSFRDSQFRMVSTIKAEMDKLNKTISIYQKALDSGKPIPKSVQVPKAITFKVGEHEMYMNVTGSKTTGYKIDKGINIPLKLAEDNIKNIESVISKYKDVEAEYTPSTHFTNADNFTGKLKARRESDKKYYDKHGVTKAITDFSQKKWIDYNDNSSGIVNTETFTSDDVVVVSTKFPAGKSVIASIRAAKKAGATLVLDREYTFSANASVNGRLGKFISTLTVNDIKIPYKAESGRGRSVKFVPESKAIEAKVKRDEAKAEVEKTKASLAAKLAIGLKVFVDNKGDISNLSEEDTTKYESSLNDFKGDKAKFEAFINNKLYGTDNTLGIIKSTINSLNEIDDNESLGNKKKVKQRSEVLKDLPKTIVDLVEETINNEVKEAEVTNSLISEWVEVSNDDTIDTREWLEKNGLTTDINPVTKETILTSIATDLGSYFPHLVEKGKKKVREERTAKEAKNVKPREDDEKVISRSKQALNIKDIVKVGKVTLLGTFKISDIKLKGEDGKFLTNFMEAAVETLSDTVAPILNRRATDVTFVEDNALDPIKVRLMDNPALGLLMDAKGKVNDNTAVAIYIAALNFISTNGHMIKDGIKSRKDLAAMLGKREEEITSDMQAALVDKGVLHKTIVTAMGKDILNQLGLQDKELDTVDRQVYNKLIADLGQLGVLAGVKRGFLKVDKTMKAREFAKELLKKTDKEVKALPAKATMTFIVQEDALDIEAIRDTMDNLNSLLPVENTLRKEPSYSKLTKDEVASQVKEIKRDMFRMGIADESKESLEKLMNTEWIMDITLAKEIVDNAETIKTALGFIEIGSESYAKLSSVAKESQESINRDIDKAIDEIKRVTDTKDTDVSMWFKYYMSKNGRLMLDSNTLNPQTVKQLHRFLIQPKDHLNTYTVAKGVDGYTKFTNAGKDVTHMIHYSVGQAFGFAVDKKNPDAIKSFGNEVIKSLTTNASTLKKAHKGFMNNGEYDLNTNITYTETFEGYNVNKLKKLKKKDKTIKSIKKVTDSEGKVNTEITHFESVTLEKEHFSHALQAFKFLKDIQEGKSEVSSYLTAEFDAVTSGFGLKLMQIPLLDQESMDKYLTKVGILKKGNPIIDQLDNVDSLTMNAVLDNPVNVEDSVLDSYQELSSLIKDLEYSELSDDRDVEISEEEDAKVWEALRKVLPKIEDGKITSALRNLFKYPFMLFNYGASTNSIKNLIASEVFNDLLTKLSALDLKKAKKEKDPYYDLMVQLADSSNIKNIMELQENLRGGTDPDNILRIDRVMIGDTDVSLKSYLEGFIKASYGTQVETILNKEFAPFIKAQKSINNAFNGMFELFFSAYENEYAKAKKEGNNVVSVEKDREILDSLKKLMPSIAGPLSNIEEAYREGRIGIYDTDSIQVDGAMGGLHGAKAILSKDVKAKIGTGQSSIKVSSFMKQFKAAYSSGNVIPIHYIDGAMMSRTINEAMGGITAIHDAIIASLMEAEKTVKVYNKNTFELNKDYSFVEEIANSFKVMSNLINETEESKQLDRSILDKEIIVGEGKKAKKVTVEENFITTFNELTKFADEVKVAREALFDSLEGAVIVHMAATPDASYKTPETPDRTTSYKNPTKNIMKEVNEDC